MIAMNHKTKFLPALLLATFPFSTLLAQSPAPAPAAEIALAERVADRALFTLELPSLSTAQYRQAGVLLQAASRMAPAEPRFPRLRHEALLQAGEIADAIDALVAYARLEPNDLQAQAKLIELYVQRMETADEKLKYLRQDLLGTNTIPSEIRSHAALLAARVLLERGEKQAAITALNEAARLNPVNPEVQQLRFEMVSSRGTPNDRLNGLLTVVRAGPMRVGAVAAVAEELSRAGLGDEAAVWYDAALGSFLRSNQLPPHDFVLDYASRLLANGQYRDAEGIIGRLLSDDPADTNAQLLRLALDRAVAGNLAPTDAAANNLKLARTALVNQFIDVARSVGDSSATTRPAATTESFPYPDPVAVADAIKAKSDPALVDAFTSAAGELALFQLIYAGEAPPARALLAGLAVLQPQDALILARIDGWAYVVEEKPAEARARLSGVADRDPIAALGLIRLDSESTDPALRQAAESRARQIRSNNTHGISGAITSAELASRRVPVVLSASAEQMKSQLAGFPTQILRLADAPDTFYILRAEPVSPLIEYGQPLLVKVTLLNTSDLDLAIAEGSIRNDLWFDASVRGMRSASFPSTAYDRLGGPLVLRPRQVATRIVRVDRGALSQFLRSNPIVSLPIFGSVLTNPISTGRIVPGPGGYAVQFSRVVEQAPVPFLRPDARRQLVDSLSSAAPAKRLGLIDAAVVYYESLSKPDEKGARQLPPEDVASLRAALDALLADPEPVSRAYGTFYAIRFATGDRRALLSKNALADAYWGTRLLALAGLRDSFRTSTTDTDIKPLVEFAAQLSSDPDPSVSSYAKAVARELEQLN